MSKIGDALALYDGGMNAHAAATKIGIQASAVYKAIKQRKALVSGRCPCCNQPLPAEKRKDLTAI